jgi:hypothetical protein
MNVLLAILYLLFIVGSIMIIGSVIGYFIGYVISLFKPKNEPTIQLSEPHYDTTYIKPYQIEMTQNEYKNYIKTDKWKAKRQIRLILDNYTCQYCGSNLLPDPHGKDIAHIHHLNYRHLGYEDVENDLVSLCADCHMELHRNFSIPEMEQEINFKRMQHQ